MYDEVLTSWNGHDLCYPLDPQQTNQRWFLRTSATLSGKSVAIIGINPSSAVELGLRKTGHRGDSTTDQLLKRFSRAHLDRQPFHKDEPVFDNLVILNLIPHTGSNNDALPDWRQETGRREIIDSFESTKQIWSRVLNDVSDVILIWGNPNDPRYPWKSTAIRKLEPCLKSLCHDKNVWAVLSKKSPHFPYHPRYPQWRNLPLTQVEIS